MAALRRRCLLKRLWSILTALTLLAFPANAEQDTDISGTWNFTANLRIPCEFTGQAKLAPSADKTKSDYTCEMTARQYCPSMDIDYTVRQSCKVRNTRGQVWVQATIEEFLTGPETGNYYPDNFNLSIQSRNEMVGALVSSGTARSAVWTRTEGSIS